MRIGLIDDEPIVLELLGEFLRELGHHVTSADSGERFLAGTSLGDPGFDLVLTDFTMPGISGTSLIRELRHRFPEASLIVMSGFTETLSPDDDTFGVYAFLGKPIRLGELDVLLRRLADGRAAGLDARGD